MAVLLSGKPVAEHMCRDIRLRCEKLSRRGVTPTLGIVRVGRREEDIAYERGAIRRAESLNIAVRRFLLPAALRRYAGLGQEVTFLGQGSRAEIWDTAAYEALEAGKALKEAGISARIINMATIKPLDKEAVLKAAGETGAIMTIEDHSIFGGLGSAVAEVVAWTWTPSWPRPRLWWPGRVKRDRHFGQGAVPARSAEKCEKG